MPRNARHREQEKSRQTALPGLFLGAGNAAVVIDQNQPNSPVIMASVAQTGLAQSFGPAGDNVAGAGILLDTLGEPTGTVTISLWTNLPNAGGTLLASGSSEGTAGEWGDVLEPF